MMTDLWTEHREKDLLQKINAAQAVLNHKQYQNEANEEVALELDTEQTVNATSFQTSSTDPQDLLFSTRYSLHMVPIFCSPNVSKTILNYLSKAHSGLLDPAIIWFGSQMLVSTIIHPLCHFSGKMIFLCHGL
jgi:hypothetical protein